MSSIHLPNPGAARAQLDAMFAHVENAHPGALIEISYCWPGKDAITRARMFPNTPDGRQEAAEFGAATSVEATNVYVAPSLRKPGTDPTKRARKGDVLGSPTIWLDFDTPGAIEDGTRRWRELAMPPALVVVTGRAPSTRAQAFWTFDGIVEDQAELDSLLAGAHVRLGFVADPKVLNADRVMRLAGTLSHPKAGKEGRRLEVTEFHRPAGAPDRPRPLADAAELFPPREVIPARKGHDVMPGNAAAADCPGGAACRCAGGVAADLLAPAAAAAPAADSGPPAAVAPAPALSTPPAAPAALAPAPAAAATVAEREFDLLGRRTDGRDEYAMRVIGGAIRNLAAALGRWPSAQELLNDAWPTYESHVAPKRQIPGEEHRAGLEREGRGPTWFAEKCETHVRRAQSGHIAGLETVEKAIEAARMNELAAAARAASGMPGGDGAPAFGTVGLTLPPTAPAARMALPLPDIRTFRLGDGTSIPRRRWLYGRHLIRGYVSATISPGGIGKSSLVLVEALAMVTGRALLGEYPIAPLRVWVWNGEDPLDELDRRATAAALHYRIAPHEIDGRLFLDSGREKEIKIALGTRDGVIVQEHVVESIIEHIKANKIDVVIVDPFVSCHAVPENDNNAIDAVVKTWGRIAEACGVAVELVHHSRKPPSAAGGAVSETTVDDARGAGALLAAVRSARTLNRMGKHEAERWGIERPASYFRVDNGKANLAPPGDAATWRQMVGFSLPNGDAGLPGDEVGVAERWAPPSPFDDVTAAHLAEVQARLARAEAEGDPYRSNSQASRWAGEVVADVLGLEIDPEDEEGCARVKHRIASIIEVWKASDALVEIEIKDGQRKKKKALTSGARF